MTMLELIDGLEVFQMAVGSCALMASMIAGFLRDKVNMRMPFYLYLAPALTACLMLFFVKESNCRE
ncbi:MAG: hypothetical protein APR62_08150 [Smithella sp. SDB]|nr:MAG: hypothetical protein APR62_08150 [Smithella sp. SDB]